MKRRVKPTEITEIRCVFSNARTKHRPERMLQAPELPNGAHHIKRKVDKWTSYQLGESAHRCWAAPQRFVLERLGVGPLQNDVLAWHNDVLFRSPTSSERNNVQHFGRVTNLANVRLIETRFPGKGGRPGSAFATPVSRQSGQGIPNVPGDEVLELFATMAEINQVSYTLRILEFEINI